MLCLLGNLPASELLLPTFPNLLAVPSSYALSVEVIPRIGVEGYKLALVNFQPTFFGIYSPKLQSWVSLLRSKPKKMELPVSSETSALKAQIPGDDPKDTRRHSTHGESLK